MADVIARVSIAQHSRAQCVVQPDCLSARLMAPVGSWLQRALSKKEQSNIFFVNVFYSLTVTHFSSLSHFHFLKKELFHYCKQHTNVSKVKRIVRVWSMCKALGLNLVPHAPLWHLTPTPHMTPRTLANKNINKYVNICVLNRLKKQNIVLILEVPCTLSSNSYFDICGLFLFVSVVLQHALPLSEMLSFLCF